MVYDIWYMLYDIYIYTCVCVCSTCKSFMIPHKSMTSGLWRHHAGAMGISDVALLRGPT